MWALLLISCLVDHEAYQTRLDELSDRDQDGFTPDQGDCDDADVDANPRAEEVCDGIDNDCDGLVDDEDDSVVGQTWYVDADGDGYGSELLEGAACDEPSGAVQRDGDCDDSAPSVNPGADEVCGDGLDNDCSGGVADCRLEGGLSTAEAVSTIRGAEAELGMGDAQLALWDHDVDGNPSIAVSTNNPPGVVLWSATPGQEEITSGSIEIPLEQVPSTLKVAGRPSFTWSGGQWLAVESANGDVPLLLFEPVTDDTSSPAGELVLTTKDSSTDTSRADAPGDLDGDGLADLVVTHGTPAESYAYFVSGPLSAVGELELPADSTATLLTDVSSYLVPQGLGDIDGDGESELGIGVPLAESAAGGLIVLPDPIEDGDLEDQGVFLEGESPGDGAGALPGSLGDLTGDGLDDFQFGTTFGSDSGDWEMSTYIIAGPGAAGGGQEVAHAIVHSDRHTAGAVLGESMDIDGDAVMDLCITAGNASTGTFESWLFYGPIPEGVLDVADADVAMDWEDSALVHCIPDWNGDGVDDFLVASPDDSTLAEDGGAVYLFLGQGI